VAATIARVQDPSAAGSSSRTSRYDPLGVEIEVGSSSGGGGGIGTSAAGREQRHVNARNHGFDARRYLEGIPAGRVKQFHLAGHEDHGDVVVDTHDHPVCDAVWDLYRVAVGRFGPQPTIIERDALVPELSAVGGSLKPSASSRRGAVPRPRRPAPAVRRTSSAVQGRPHRVDRGQDPSSRPGG
jgi:hypothetical protein